MMEVKISENVFVKDEMTEFEFSFIPEDLSKEKKGYYPVTLYMRNYDEYGELEEEIGVSMTIRDLDSVSQLCAETIKIIQSQKNK